MSRFVYDKIDEDVTVSPIHESGVSRECKDYNVFCEEQETGFDIRSIQRDCLRVGVELRT